MKKRMLSLALTLCLFLSSPLSAYAWQDGSLPEGEALAEESASRLAARDNIAPTPAEAYAAMIALKEQDGYKEGTPWTNDEPYSDSKGYYRWKGGTLEGTNIVAVGCVAFAFILSDAAFGSLPARMYAAGGFDFDDIKPGDILRVSNDVHTVIVLEVNEAGVVVAEGNISTGDHQGKVHWGRAISKEEVMSNTSHYITRYPEGYDPPDDSEADVSIGSGTLEGGLSWNLTKAGTLTISDQGAMPDFVSAEEQPWSEKSSQIRKVILGDGVTSIGACAFWNCGVLSVELSPTVEAIGNSAFRESSIISVSIPSNVKSIGDSAFQKCENLSSVTISEGLETINQNAFNACMNLNSIVLPASIGEVGAAAFFQCQKLTSATFMPGSKKVTLGDNMFTGCYSLMNVTLPKSADCISAGMFQNCIMLPGVEIPQDVTSIKENAFASCSALSVVIIPKSVTNIVRAFLGSGLRNIYYTGTEEEWNKIQILQITNDNSIINAEKHFEYAQADIANAKVTLEKTAYTYDGTAKTPSVTVELNGKKLSLGVDYIVSYQNNKDVGTATVTVTGRVEYKGSKTEEFTIQEGNGGSEGDDSGSDITPPGGDGSGSDSAPGGDGSGSDSTPGGDGSGSDSTPGEDGSGSDSAPGGGGSGTGDGSSSGDSQSPEPTPAPLAKGRTFTVGKATYKVTKAGKEVELAKSTSTAKKVTVNTVKGTDGVNYKVTSIGAKAMQNNKKITSLVIGANVKKIGANAFAGCTKLAAITFGKNVTSIGTGAFKGCTGLKKAVTLPDSVKTIGANAFSGCSKIPAVTIGKTSKSKLAAIGKSAFSGCKKLAKVTVKSTKLTSIGKSAFKGAKSSMKVKVPSKQWKKYKKILKKVGLKEKQVTK